MYDGLCKLINWLTLHHLHIIITIPSPENAKELLQMVWGDARCRTFTHTTMRVIYQLKSTKNMIVIDVARDHKKDTCSITVELHLTRFAADMLLSFILEDNTTAFDTFCVINLIKDVDINSINDLTPCIHTLKIQTTGNIKFEPRGIINTNLQSFKVEYIVLNQGFFGSLSYCYPNLTQLHIKFPKNPRPYKPKETITYHLPDSITSLRFYLPKRTTVEWALVTIKRSNDTVTRMWTLNGFDDIHVNPSSDLVKEHTKLAVVFDGTSLESVQRI
ncbi:hypothetical protein BDB01DRAFT_789273, partial [Pilobolus umbonatus]